jgi:hypothetical protein
MKVKLISPQQLIPALMLASLTVLLAASLVLGQWPDYAQWTATLDQPLSRLRWIVADISEVTFYKHELPALGLLLGACLAHWAYIRGYRCQGFAICYGSGLWPWVFISSLLGFALWGWTLASGAWQPTFVAFVSLPAAMVLLFGGGWQVTITGAVLGALLVAPASLLLVNYLCYPLQLPAVIGNVSGMAVASVWLSCCAGAFHRWSSAAAGPRRCRLLRQTRTMAWSGHSGEFWPISAKGHFSEMNWPVWGSCWVCWPPTC